MVQLQMMKEEMEENKHKYQESSAVIAKNHSLELKDFGEKKTLC